MIAGLLRDHGVNRAQISISCVGSTLIRKLNREYLQRDCVTDVIAFDLSAGGSGGIYSPLVGDVYICVPRALEQAARLNLGGEEEIVRLAAHGVLHLLGYDHEKPADASEMTELQEEYVKKIIPLPEVFI